MDNKMEPLVHIPGAHPEWNESYYLCFSDRVNGVSGMTRLGFKPNKQEATTFFLLFLPDGSVAGFQATEKMSGSTDHLRVAGMTHERHPDGSWHYTFQGMMAVVKNPADFPKIREKPIASKAYTLPLTRPLIKMFRIIEPRFPSPLSPPARGGDKRGMGGF